MRGGARHQDDRPGRAAAMLGRALVAVCLALALPAPGNAGTEDLAVCLEAKTTLRAYADEFVARGWRPVGPQDAGFDHVMQSTAEIIGTLHTFPLAFTEPSQVRAHVDRIASIGRRAASASQVALLARDGLALMITLDTKGGEARLSCYLSAKVLPDVAAHLPEPGRNPSGAPLAWNVTSSGPLATPHVFAEIMYLRLFYQPAQHLLTGGCGVITHLRFRREAEAT